MSKIAQLQNKIVELEKSVQDIMASDAEDKAVKAAEVNGQLIEARAALVEAAEGIEAENAAIIEAQTKKQTKKVANAIEQLLGAEDSFKGIEPGFKGTISNAVSGLTTPQRYDETLPAPVEPIMGFLDTIPMGSTDGDEHYFQMGSFTNNAAGWVEGEEKAESDIEWTPAVAHIETVAHWVPISKMAARRYKTLESTVRGALMLGLRMKNRAYAVLGSNSNGIVGITNQAGIITHTKGDEANAYELAVNMKAKVRKQSGFMPNYVALPSDVVAGLKILKDSNGRYLYPEIVRDGKLDGMTIIEDDNLAGSSSNGMLVYFNGGAEWLTADADEVTIGLIDKQFVKNSYTLLGEGTHSLKVTFPKAFAYCAAI